MATTLANRRNESRERRMDPVKEIVHQESILQDADALQDALNKASKGGKKKIVGLYLPDGNKIDTNVKVETQLQKAHEAAAMELEEDLSNITHLKMKKKDKKQESLERRTKVKQNLAEVAQTYTTAREFRQKRAARERRSEEEIEDEEAERKARSVLHKSDERDVQTYEKLFNFFDVDKDQNWGSIEFAQRMTDIGFPTGVEDAANLLYFAGVRDVDRITYNDFLAMMPKLKAFRRLIEKDAMRAFSEKDDGSGFLSIKQLKEVIQKLSGPDAMDKAWVEAICRKADRERTGRIPFDFFIMAMFGSKPIIPYQRDPKTIQTPMQRAMASFGRFCGAQPKQSEDSDHRL